jgi:DNA-binding MarR family transcriptional regulator
MGRRKIADALKGHDIAETDLNKLVSAAANHLAERTMLDQTQNALMEYLAQQCTILGITELARRLNEDKSNLHKVLNRRRKLAYSLRSKLVVLARQSGRSSRS